ncbi:MAG: hypothetical protein R3242_09095 [Akkermansiaceae bacterium]|nr:hypothetical protein [Akkermansiaceae bacterium]
MKIDIPAIICSVFSIALMSCGERESDSAHSDYADPVNSASVKAAIEASEYVALCDVEKCDVGLRYRLNEVLYTKEGVEVPWEKGELVVAAHFENRPETDKAVIFYQIVNDEIAPGGMHTFCTTTSQSDADKFEKLVTAINDTVANNTP